MKKSLIAISMAALLLQGCYSDNSMRDKPPFEVETLLVQQPVDNQYREFRGQVVTAEQTELAFRIQGEIAHLVVKPGQSVKQGQVVAKLNDEKLQQQYIDAQAQYELATKQLSRGSELYKRDMVSSSELDELTSSRELARARLQNITHQIEYASLRAPFDGVIGDVYKERFENVSLGEPVLSIYQDNKVYVQLALSDHILASLTPTDQQSSHQQSNYLPVAKFSGMEQSYTMHYLEHSSEPNSQSQTYELWLEMPQPNTKILPGTSATIYVDMVAAGLSTVQGYQLPMTVLQAGRKNGEFYVWKYQDGKVNRASVHIDQVNSQGVIVDAGVSQGDVLIGSNLTKLRDGQAVALKGNK